jgi:hypothetical protein
VGSGAQFFSNAGTINVNAAATQVGTTGHAFAQALGYHGFHKSGAQYITAINSGSMNVSATAVASEAATAEARGMWIENAYKSGVANPVFGYVTNSGTMNVVASASGGTTSAAYATGIRVDSGPNNLAITNSGAINVDAITNNGGFASAYGIRVVGNGAAGAAGDVVTINNSGDIIVRVSDDGGATFHRGTAIDVSEAPNRAVINLLGNGTAAANIFGNIELQSDADTINVTDGETLFNGIINSDCYDAADIAAGGDNPTLSSCGVGTLNIDTGGNFHLAIDDVDGPSYVFMNTLNMGADGTITFDLPALGGTADPGTYPQVFVDAANLDGTLVANVTNGNGLLD